MATLYWSNKGEVACEAHAPDQDSDRWVREGWQPMGKVETIMYGSQLGGPPRCGICDAQARRVSVPTAAEKR